MLSALDVSFRPHSAGWDATLPPSGNWRPVRRTRKPKKGASCPLCSAKMKKSNYVNHMEVKCPSRKLWKRLSGEMRAKILAEAEDASQSKQQRPKENIQHHQDFCNGAVRECTFCSKTFKSRRSLENHLTEHAVTSAVQACVECSENFPDKLSFKAHMMECHTVSQVILKCSVCAESFDAKSKLRLHMKKQHTASETRKNCGICAESFPDLPGLDLHMETHMATKLLGQCGICSKSFADQKYLKTHMRLHAIVGFSGSE
jgi:hypothetical protein